MPFDRDKLMRSVQVALRKRQVDPERVERMLNGIVRQLESAGEAEVPSDQIGLLVMEGLKRLDDVAYVRFASVYRNFREAKDFETLLGELSGDVTVPSLETPMPTTNPPSQPVDPELDRRLMAAALRLGRRNLGRTGTNPSVGALIVRPEIGGPRVLGRGWTALGGRPHAEVQALAEAGEDARGATAYVTLEPCSHTGQTPPCANALIEAGVARVVTTMTDPDPRVSGRGLPC